VLSVSTLPTNVVVGAAVIGGGIPLGATVVSKNLVSVTISVAATISYGGGSASWQFEGATPTATIGAVFATNIVIPAANNITGGQLGLKAQIATPRAGSQTAGSAVLAASAVPTGIIAGASVFGPGIAPGTTVISIAGNNLTISPPATTTIPAASWDIVTNATVTRTTAAVTLGAWARVTLNGTAASNSTPITVGAVYSLDTSPTGSQSMGGPVNGPAEVYGANSACTLSAAATATGIVPLRFLPYGSGDWNGTTATTFGVGADVAGRVLGVAGAPGVANTVTHRLGEVDGIDSALLTVTDVPLRSHAHPDTFSATQAGHSHGRGGSGAIGTGQHGIIKRGDGAANATIKASISVGGAGYGLLDASTNEPMISDTGSNGPLVRELGLQTDAPVITISGGVATIAALPATTPVSRRQPSAVVGKRLFIYGGAA
jgi:hypothetical protein